MCALPQVARRLADHAGDEFYLPDMESQAPPSARPLGCGGPGAAAALVEWLQALHFCGCALLAAITGVELKGLKMLAQFFTIIAARWDSAKRLRERVETDRAAGWWRFAKPRPRRGAT